MSFNVTIDDQQSLLAGPQKSYMPGDFNAGTSPASRHSVVKVGLGVAALLIVGCLAVASSTSYEGASLLQVATGTRVLAKAEAKQSAAKQAAAVKEVRAVYKKNAAKLGSTAFSGLAAAIMTTAAPVAPVQAAVDAAPVVQPGAATFSESDLAAQMIPAPEVKVAAPAYQTPDSSRWSYSVFLEALANNDVREVALSRTDGKAVVITKGGKQAEVVLPNDPALLQMLNEKDVVTSVQTPKPGLLDILSAGVSLLFPLGTLLFLFLLFRGGQGQGPLGGPGNPMAMGKSNAKFQMDPETGVKFDDIAGVNEAKKDFEEVVEFLKRPERFTAVGAKIPKGVLLVGPPGTGKTLLAKGIAGEAGVPFFSIAGSEFVEMFVGVGASRVRDLFKKAKETAPCIIFVDEIDAVGRSRGAGVGGGNDEREQTLNQLLTEMDGFEGNTGVIVIAATNRADILDPALLRPGRFDRQVSVDVPDVKGRREILNVHSRNKLLGPDVNLDTVALRTPGFSGAELANLLNEAAILTGRRNKDTISNLEIDDAIDRVVAGMEGKPLTDGKAKLLVAYHEVGHAICGTLTPGHDAVQKVTLIPRGQARGLTWFQPGDDPSLLSKKAIRARIVGALGGRAAEETIFGPEETTSGAASDLQQVSGMAKQMVINYGFSEIGPWQLQDPSAQGGDMIMRMMAKNTMSEELASEIDKCVKEISDDAYAQALQLMVENREAIDIITNRLCEIETLSGDEFREILSRYTTIPEENLAAVEALKKSILAAEKVKS